MTFDLAGQRIFVAGGGGMAGLAVGLARGAGLDRCPRGARRKRIDTSKEKGLGWRPRARQRSGLATTDRDFLSCIA